MIKLSSLDKPLNTWKNKLGTIQETHGILYYKAKSNVEYTKVCMQFLKDAYYGDSDTSYVKFECHGKIPSYSKEEIEKWINFIKSNFNLQFEYDGQYFTISKDHVKSGFKMYITLILIRYLWYPCSNIIDETYRILEQEKEIDPFLAVQIAHYNKYFNNATFELFTTNLMPVPVTREKLLKDFESNEKGTTITKSANQYFGFTAFVSGTESKQMFLNYELQFLFICLLRKYYSENNFKKVLDVIQEYSDMYKLVSKLDGNTNSITNTLKNDEAIKIAGNILETLFEKPVSNIEVIVNNSLSMKEYVSKKHDNSYCSMRDQSSILKLEGFRKYDYNSGDHNYYYVRGTQINRDASSYSSLPNSFLTFNINEK